MKPRPPQLSAEWRRRIARLLSRAGLPGQGTLSLVKGGGNNRVWKLRCEGRALLVKQYFRNPNDPRDRFGAERAFYRFLQSHRNRRVPAALAWDAMNGLALFEFIEGRKLRRTEIGGARVNEALGFFLRVNRHRENGAAKDLPDASESCFSVAQHLDRIGERVRRLGAIKPRSRADREAARFVARRLDPAWAKIRESILRRVRLGGEQLAAPLPRRERCVSPSDFGFHNALLTGDGKLRFFDFEYAGWDDPAKMACDFFCQPALPAPHRCWNAFLRRALPRRAARMRARLLLPAYRVKWCCILLNEFVPAGRARRRFARAMAGAEARKARQLSMARTCLAGI